MNHDLDDLLSPSGRAAVAEAESAFDKLALEGDRSAIDRLEARVRQDTLGSAKGPRPTPPVRSPKRKARAAVRAARRLNRKAR